MFGADRSPDIIFAVDSVSQRNAIGECLVHGLLTMNGTTRAVAFVGRTLKQLELRPRLGLTLIAIKRQADAGAGVITNIAPSADEKIRSGDVLALLGSNERLNQLDQLLTG